MEKGARLLCTARVTDECSCWRGIQPNVAIGNDCRNLDETGEMHE